MYIKYFCRFTKSLADWNISKSDNVQPSAEQIELIKELNALDIELYKFATKLFNRRMALIKNGDLLSFSFSSSSVFGSLNERVFNFTNSTLSI